ncbi:MAG: DUF742 domain-containing protein [Acidimicrobiales bacterium]
MEFDDEEEVVGQTVVRSFLVTGGRTHSDTQNLQFETLVEVNPSAQVQNLQFEKLDIARHVSSQDATSVAEIAAALRLPMLTAHVLVSDLVSEAVLTAHETANSQIDLSSLTDIRAAILSL